MSGLFSQVMNLTVIFTPWLLLAIFLMTLFSEFGLSVPYLMETVWLFSGYNFVAGNISLQYLILFCAVGLIGRLAGSSILFYLSWYGKAPLGTMLNTQFKPRLKRIISHFPPLQLLMTRIGLSVLKIAPQMSSSTVDHVHDTRTLRLLGRKFKLSPFTVALGRFLWMRLPITIALGTQKQRTSLLWGVTIFSVVWDGAYITFGALGGRGGLQPAQMMLYPLGVMIFISATVFIFRKIRYSAASR